MARSKRKNLTPDEQTVLDQVQVRLLSQPDDVVRCDQLISEHHYLHDATLVGEHLRYAITYEGRWLALATWSGAALHLKARDQFIGWTGEQCRCRRGLIANNARLLVLPDCRYPNLISRFMKLMLGRLSQDWTHWWNHPVVLAETFVDPQLYQGTAYKVSGWSHLGRTAGWKRDAADFYQKHNAPKQIWVRELVKKACLKLRAPQLPAAWASGQMDRIPRCTAKAKEIRGLIEALRQGIPEFRRPQALAYPVAGLLALIVMAMTSGVQKGPDDLAQYAATLSQGQLRALRFRQERGGGRVRCPKKTVFHTVLTQVDAATLEQVLLIWQEQLLGPPQDPIVIVDGKKLRHGKVEMVNAVTGSGRYLGGVITPRKSSEVCAARQVLRGQDLVGKTVLTDALHTNEETAKQILFEQGGDYVMTVKGNQPTIQKTLETLFAKQGFSPTAQFTHSSDPPAGQSGPGGDTHLGLSGSHPQPGRLSGSPTGRAIGNAREASGQVDAQGDLPAKQLHSPGVAGSRIVEA